MSKSKSIFVTALVAVMLAAILVGLYMLENKTYMVFVGLLGLYGFACAAFNFCQWMGRETPLRPVPEQKKISGRKQDGLWKPDKEWAGRYDDIKAEVKSKQRGGVTHNGETA